MRTTTNNLRIKSLSRRAIQLVSLVLALTVWAAWIAPSAHTSNRSAPLGPSALAGEVHALFDLRAPDGGPFPSDVFTVTDPNQNRTRVAFDALGMVVGTAVMGKPRLHQGDIIDSSFVPDLKVADIQDFVKDPRGQA